MLYVQILLFHNVLFFHVVIDSTVTSMRKLKIANNNSLRKTLTLPKYNGASDNFLNLNIPSFDMLLQKFVYSFTSRTQDSGNSLVNGTIKSSLPSISTILAWWSDILTHNHSNSHICVCENELALE